MELSDPLSTIRNTGSERDYLNHLDSDYHSNREQFENSMSFTPSKKV